MVVNNSEWLKPQVAEKEIEVRGGEFNQMKGKIVGNMLMEGHGILTSNYQSIILNLEKDCLPNRGFLNTRELMQFPSTPLIFCLILSCKTCLFVYLMVLLCT